MILLCCSAAASQILSIPFQNWANLRDSVPQHHHYSILTIMASEHPSSPNVICSYDDHPIPPGDLFHVEQAKFYCDYHFAEKFLPHCFGCKEPIKGQYITLADQSQWHATGCWLCIECSKPLSSTTVSTEAVSQPGTYKCLSCAPSAAVAADTSGHTEQKATAGLSKLEQLKLQKEQDAKLAAGPIVDPSVSPSFPLEQLKKSYAKKIGAIDTAKRELYLSDQEFHSYFKMSKADFSKLPQWKRDNEKKKLDLF
jgi:hypothetical protein